MQDEDDSSNTPLIIIHTRTGIPTFQYPLRLHDISHVIFNVNLVSKASPVISGNFNLVCDFKWSCIYHTEQWITALCGKCALNIASDLYRAALVSTTKHMQH